MRKFIRRLGWGRGFAVCVLGLVVSVIGLCVFQTYASLTPEEEAKGKADRADSGLDSTRYDYILSWEMEGVDDLGSYYTDAQRLYLPIAPPSDQPYLQHGTPGMVPVDLKHFPLEFVKGLIGQYVNGIKVFPLTVLETPEGETVFFNAHDEKIYSIAPPTGYDPNWFVLEKYPDLWTKSEDEIAYLTGVYAPSRIRISVVLIEKGDVAQYLYNEAAIQEAAIAALPDLGGGGMMMMGMGDETNHLYLALDGPPQNLTNTVRVRINIPSGFTNRLSVFSLDVDGTNQFRGIESVWQVADTNLMSAGTNEVRWLEEDQMGRTPFMEITNRRYYRIINEERDQDQDQLSDGYELHISKTFHDDPDTDDDSLSDGWEVLHGLDPLDDGSGDPDNGAAGNPDDDDWSNFQEYNLGLNPVISNTVDSSNTAGLTVHLPSSL